MRALVVIDVQNDFLPGGALAVRQGEEIIEVVSRVQNAFSLIVATQDWHPAGHESFASTHPGRKVGDVINLHGLQQVLWPDHCVQGSPGADFAKGVQVSAWSKVFQKGTRPEVDSYSGFFDNGRRFPTGLGDYLKSRGVTEVYALGLATDYCVKFTVLDALALGFRTTLIEDGCRAVDLSPGDGARAVLAMRAGGAEVLRSNDVKKEKGHASH